MSSETSTPPHNPTYGVKLSTEQLEAIVAVALPPQKLVQSSELARGKSFNNRIYFLEVEANSTGPQRYVLRVCGHFFGKRKVQNEVGWLLKLKQYCPSIPVPEVVAWSEEGDTVETSNRGALDLSNHQKAISKHGWVLQTRLPGRVLTIEDLDGPHGSAILHQLALHLATWRTDLPSDGAIGNMSLPSLDDRSVSALTATRDFVAAGLLLTHTQETPPGGLQNWSEYYQFLLSDQYGHMMRSPQLEPLRAVVEDDVERFLKRLFSLPFLAGEAEARFTHMDFAPRNILLADAADVDQPPQVSGILDFEFSAFLPAPAEFLNSLVNQPDDWPSHHYKTLLTHLRNIENDNSARSQRQSVCIPVTEPPEPPCEESQRCQCNYHKFECLSVLEAVIANVAPWYIMPNSHAEDSLQAECQKAAKIVQEGIKRLEMLLPLEQATNTTVQPT